MSKKPLFYRNKLAQNFFATFHIQLRYKRFLKETLMLTTVTIKRIVFYAAVCNILAINTEKWIKKHYTAFSDYLWS